MEFDAELAAELARIQEMPIVLNVATIGKAGSALNAVRVRASLKAAYVQEDSRRRPMVTCSRERPTLLEAARALRKKLINEYESENDAAALDSPVIRSRDEPVNSAWSALRAGATAHKQLRDAVRAAEENLRDADDAVNKAERARAAAAGAALAAREALKKFEAANTTSSHKRQRRVFEGPAASSSLVRVEEEGGGEVEDAPPKKTNNYWDEWSLKKWRELERKNADARAVRLSSHAAARMPSKMPRGEDDGPLTHQRHGLIGAVQYWAEGSAEDAAKIVSNLIKRLGLKV